MKKKAKGKIRFRIFFLIWFAICILAGCAWIGHFYKEGWQGCQTASPRDTLAQKEIESDEYRLKKTDEQGDSVPVRLAGLRMSSNSSFLQRKDGVRRPGSSCGTAWCSSKRRTDYIRYREKRYSKASSASAGVMT